MPLDYRMLLNPQGPPNLMQNILQGVQAGHAIRNIPMMNELRKLELQQKRQEIEQAPIIAEQKRRAFEREQALKERQAEIKEQELKLKQESLLKKGDEQAIKNLLDIRKEVRASVGKEISSIKSDANSIKSNFNKIKNLTSQIQKGNRTAVSQGLVALVKLGDPGSIVNESEMKAALNAQNPVAAITSLLSGKGVSDDITQSIASKIDPLDPTNVNVNDLLATADALVQANVPSLQQRFASEQDRATENLTPEGFKSIFDKRTIDSISGLSDLKAGQIEQKEKIMSGLPSGTVDNGDGTFTLPDGRKVRRKRGNP